MAQSWVVNTTCKAIPLVMHEPIYMPNDDHYDGGSASAAFKL